MREKILNLLIQSKETYIQIINELSERLPENLIASCKDSIENQIPKFGNNILMILNRAEMQSIYDEENNIDQLIEIFKNPDLDASILKAQQNNHILRELGKGSLNTNEVLNDCVERITSSLQLLQMHLIAGNLK